MIHLDAKYFTWDMKFVCSPRYSRNPPTLLQTLFDLPQYVQYADQYCTASAGRTY